MTNWVARGPARSAAAPPGLGKLKRYAAYTAAAYEHARMLLGGLAEARRRARAVFN